MDKKYWAKRGRKIVGPCDSRDAALDAFRKAYPVKGPDWKVNAKKNDILTGYGEFGPHFDMRWDKA
jgi:hypothetical protein